MIEKMQNSRSKQDYSDLLKAGFEYYRKGLFDKAKDIFEKIVEYDKENIDALFFLGVVYYELKSYDKSLNYFEKALSYSDRNPIVYVNMGTVYKEIGDFENAFLCYQKAIKIDPAFTEAYNHLGTLYQETRQFDIAEEYYKRALSLNPNFADAYYNIGTILKEKELFDDAQEYILKALSLNPLHREGLVNLGDIQKEKGEMSKGLGYYKQAISVSPDYPEAHFNLACVYLLLGNFEEGWAEYEWRWKTKEFEALRRDFGKPRWYGEEIRGKRIFLTCEQGLGDAIQFVRYAKRVKDLGAEVILEVPKVLHRLFMCVEGIDSLVIVGSEVPNFDVYCPLLSLPYVFRTNLETIPNEVPYIKVNSETIEMWREKIEKGKDRLNVGIAWTGNPKHKRDKYRSIRLEKFAIFNELKGVRFYSLQVGVGSEQLKEVGSKFEIVDLTGEIKDFFDTAGLIMNLDLVITVDTSVAHLAGALGKQVWVFIPFVPDWRWMLNREDSPWYPTMRLFRQNERNDWDSVIKRVYEELGKLVNK
jgi:tetratricopeptide (TPR) repeat protein